MAGASARTNRWLDTQVIGETFWVLNKGYVAYGVNPTGYFAWLKAVEKWLKNNGL